MQKHAEEAHSLPNPYGNLKSVASHTDLDSLNSEHWFEKITNHMVKLSLVNIKKESLKIA